LLTIFVTCVAMPATNNHAATVWRRGINNSTYDWPEERQK